MKPLQPDLVTVVVPVHNARRHIGETLDSLLAQTHSPVEIVAVDDGSTDETAPWIEARYPRVRVVRQANAGVSAARNAGLALARGAFVAFVDQDDVWHPLQLERQLQVMQQHPEAVAVATPYAFWHPGADGRWAPLPLPPDPGLRLVPGFEGWTYHRFLLDCWALTSATLLRTDRLREAGAFDAARPYGEDWELWLRLSRRHPFLQLQWPPVAYRQHPSQGSRRVRGIDHRCELLTQAARRWGLRSPDGQGLDRSTFRTTIARYRAEFGYHHLMHGSRRVAIASLVHAWALQPLRLRWLALAAAGAVGWRPRPARA